MKRRPGFTILELLTVMIIVGLLAAIAVSRFWEVKERSYWISVKNDLRTVATQQERFFSTNTVYANDIALLPDVALSPGVTITIVWSANNGWAATGEHTSLSPLKCGYFTGPAPVGVAAPATQSGTTACDE
ncbi:MAG: type IV pilin protein [Gemmatimonadota bacterium]